jgi:hypothetical protein
MRGALFVVNGRGEPIDFGYARIDVHASFLFRPGESRRRAVVALVKALFTAASHVPQLLIALADEVPAAVFTEDLQVALPLCRLAERTGPSPDRQDLQEDVSGTEHLFWVGSPPETESEARSLLDAIAARGPLAEPFERAAAGLREAYAAA